MTGTFRAVQVDEEADIADMAAEFLEGPDDQIVGRKIVSKKPGPVEYFLIDRGAALPRTVSGLLRWNEEFGRAEVR